jgi:choline-sulfatase
MAARSVLLSGQHNRTCTGGVGNVAFPSKPGDFAMPEYPEAGRPHLKDPSLAEVLKGLGYFTAAIGKWHIHSWPHEIGFDSFLIPRVHHCHTGQSFTRDGGAEFVPPGYSLDFECQEVAAFLRARRLSAQPFFLYYNISPPHCPVADVPERYRTMYDPATIPLRANVDPSRPLPRQEYWFKVYRWDFRYYQFHLPFTETLPAGYDLRSLTAEYYGAVTWMDDALGRLLETLDSSGADRNTVVIFTADHGDNLGSLGLVQKGGANEESIRVPLILRWPGGVQGQAILHRPASLVDIMPTLIQWAGGKVPSHVQGQSLLPLLEDPKARLEREWSVIETGGGGGLRSPSHLYFLPFKKGQKVLDERPSQVFDLTEDPLQSRNLAASPPSAATEWDGHLRRWEATTLWMRP